MRSENEHACPEDSRGSGFAILAGALYGGLILPLSAAAPAVTRARLDALQPVEPGEVVVGGCVGNRLDRNLHGILMHKDEDALLEAFRKRTVGGHPWIGEHVGKWLSAAAMAWQYSRDDEMAAKLRRVASGLIDTQLADGYLGTYGEPERWKRWDVWVHKYNLLGLQAYYDATGDHRALHACRRMADLIISRIGPGKADILTSGTHDGAVVHQGMAATSVLQPMAGLYVRAGDSRYLAFAEYVVDSLEREGGPHIVSTLLRERSVRKVANAKAYEMISNILGLLDMYRLQGNETFLEAAKIAFDDIVEHRSYLTGGSTFGEVFREEGYLPNAGHVAEMCVMMSQLQLARELLLITGDAKYGNLAEHLILNHLLAGQHPTGESICYYTPVWGHKFYMNFLGCCISSGPRAIALIPSLYYLRGKDKLAVNLLGQSTLETGLPNGETPKLVQETGFPFSDKVRIRATAPKGIGYTLAIRIPPTAVRPTMTVNGDPTATMIAPGRYLELSVTAEPVTIELDLHLQWEILEGAGANQGLFVLRHGPVIFAYDDAANSDQPRAAWCVFDRDLDKLAPKLERRDGRWMARVNGYVRDRDNSLSPCPVTLLPFADAGESSYFSVWLRDRAESPEKAFSLFTQAHENVSRKGSIRGSFADNAPDTFATTYTNERREEDWFEVDAGWHCNFNVVVFCHGKSFPNGGWFDTSQGKPRVMLKVGGHYEEAAILEGYPDTTAERPGSLRNGQAFRVVIPKDKRGPAFGVRVVGVPAHGNDPSQNFASCSEIQVLYDPDL